MGGVDFIVIVVIKIIVEFGEIFNGRILFCNYLMIFKCFNNLIYFIYVMELVEDLCILIKNCKGNKKKYLYF